MQLSTTSYKTIILVFSLATNCFFQTAHSQGMPALPDNQLQLPTNNFSIPFTWLGDSVNGKWEPHAVLLLPVKLENCRKTFYMQFDLGHPYSVFYKNKLEAIGQKYPNVIELKDSVKLTHFSFSVGKTTITAASIPVQQFDSTGINWANKKSKDIIGTIGSDLVDGKTVIIDYPNLQITVATSVPGKIKKKVSLTGFMYVMRSIILPAKINGEQTMLYFDSGSSMYELLTDKKTAEALALPNSKATQNRVRSWDRLLTANSLPSNASIEINGRSIPIHQTTFMEGMSNSQVERMMKMGIGGMTGNKLFLPYKLILDTKNKKFGLLKSN